MSKEDIALCTSCNNEVSIFKIDRYGECPTCRAEDKLNDMGVGDVNVR